MDRKKKQKLPFSNLGIINSVFSNRQRTYTHLKHVEKPRPPPFASLLQYLQKNGRQPRPSLDLNLVKVGSLKRTGGGFAVGGQRSSLLRSRRISQVPPVMRQTAQVLGFTTPLLERPQTARRAH